MPLQAAIYEEVLYWAAQGLEDQEIGKKIKKSLKTVRRYRSTIRTELQAQNEAQAVYNWLKREIKGGRFKLPQANKEISELTDIEVAVLKLVALGDTNLTIGKKLYLSPNTIKTHISRILRKLKAKNREHAIYIGLQAGILKI